MERCDGCDAPRGLSRIGLDLLTAERRPVTLCHACLMNPDADWRWRLRVIGSGDPSREWADELHPDVRLSGQVAVRIAAERQRAAA